ncbi:MAG: hypothetical protein JO327_13680 [Nitrososphaeraceae archaeon]|nr:hypothetical protein [Nitrososphaeraceae archaeon]MBV9669164.1 hypothetical protein [Nitrososphaeraceae archaeon]
MVIIPNHIVAKYGLCLNIGHVYNRQEFYAIKSENVLCFGSTITTTLAKNINIRSDDYHWGANHSFSSGQENSLNLI